MPRQQQPPDPDQGPMAAFAQKLYALRQAVGSPSYRKMGERANICHTSLSRAAKGDRFPTWETTKAFVLACDADVELWGWRWEVASRAVEEERRLQNASTVPLHPVRSPIYDLDPPEKVAAAPPGGTARAPVSRRGAPAPLTGGLPALTLQLAAEIKAGSAAPDGRGRHARTDVVLAAQGTEQDSVRNHQQSTVRLVPLGSGQRRRVVGVSSRPPGAHRKPTAAGRTPRIAPRRPKLETRFLGERPLWQRQGRTLWIVVSTLALTWIASSTLSTIIE